MLFEITSPLLDSDKGRFFGGVLDLFWFQGVLSTQPGRPGPLISTRAEVKVNGEHSESMLPIAICCCTPV